VDVEALLQNIQQVVVEDEFSPFYARRLTIKMGLRGLLIESVSAIVEKMYYLFIEKDLDLIEINPLGISAEGEVMALDGKITLNDNACERHPELVALKAEKEIPSKYSFLPPISTSTLTSPKLRWLDWDSEQGKIGIICNSFGLALITWDSISQAQGKSAGCWIVGEETTEKLLPNSYSVQQLEIALEQIKEIPGIKVVLVNILASPEITEITASAIGTYLQPESINPQDSESYLLPTRWRERNFSHRSPKGRSLGQLHFVVRLVGGKIDPIKEKLGSMPVYWTENLDEAVERSISFVKSKSL
jgi:succinyl-CoA synthetase beta subunit